ncbi:MAG: ethanolamine ammonia-lyase subunit EutC [Fimbriimonadaceae bacterium]|nr:ethanolamine ammonia-lyase subunit EutC [Fimbriimonadaceae bacterium]
MSDPATPAARLQALLARTPARCLVGGAGDGYRTATQLALRCDHAAAVDAVWGELELQQHLGAALIQRYGLFEVCSAAPDKATYLRRPDLGRRFGPVAEAVLRERCPAGADFQVVLGDGLSVAALAGQGPRLLPLLADLATDQGWRFGQPFVVRHARVGLLNEVGRLLQPAVVVLLIGERPGLSTADSLSAYLAWQPRPGDTDAQRNLVSNIHDRGTPPPLAARRIVALAAQLRAAQASGVSVKEDPRLAG